MSNPDRLRMYSDLATWWPLFSPPEHYPEEAADLVPTMRAATDHDRHQFGVFPRAAWLNWLDQAGFAATSRPDPWDRDVFVGRKRDGAAGL
jgi:hypothetical protein